MSIQDEIPPADVAESAKKALEWRKEYNRGMTLVGVARARDLSNRRRIPMNTIRRMLSFFARHAVDLKAEGANPGEPGYPSAGRIAWEGWGGNAGLRWARKRARLEESKEYNSD